MAQSSSASHANLTDLSRCSLRTRCCRPSQNNGSTVRGSHLGRGLLLDGRLPLLSPLQDVFPRIRRLPQQHRFSSMSTRNFVQSRPCFISQALALCCQHNECRGAVQSPRPTLGLSAGVAFGVGATGAGAGAARGVAKPPEMTVSASSTVTNLGISRLWLSLGHWML